MSNEIKMSERFGSVPNFDIREFMDDDRTFAIPNVELCYDDINKAVNTHDQHVARIAELEGALRECADELQWYIDAENAMIRRANDGDDSRKIESNSLILANKLLGQSK